jgi:surfeit locus 1 family protein
MRVRTVIGLLAALILAALCVRLGFWQLSRREEKRSLNRAQRAAAALPAIRAGAEPPPLDSVEGRRASFEGHFDSTRHVLLAGRSRSGVPGVLVVTPLLLQGESAVLVDRGWLPAPDAATARPQDFPEPGRLQVVGAVEALGRGRGGPPLRMREQDGVTLLSARWLDHDTLAARLPYALAPYVVHQLPGPGVPPRPARAEPRPRDEAMHLGYAIQWFSFAAILLGGAVALSRKRRRESRPS